MNGNQTPSRLRHAIILAVGLGISNFAFSLRLGPINVKSYLGQPMNAIIRVDGLNSSTAEATRVSLANAAAYRSHGIEMLPIHSQMHFSLIPSGKSYLIRVTSTGAVKEPFINFLMTVSGNGTTVTREYAAFFNPNPAITAGASNQPTVIVEKKSNFVDQAEPPRRSNHAANTSGWGGKPAPKKHVTPPVRPTPAPAPEPVAASNPNTPDSIPAGTTYGPIKPGETLYSIAKAARPNDSISVSEMMRLIYKANRGAFIRNDMGNLMAGVTLRIPDPTSRHVKSENRPAPKPSPRPKPSKSEAAPEAKPAPVPAEPAPAPEKVPTSAAAQLAFGVGNKNNDKNATRSEIPAPPVTPPPPAPAPEPEPAPVVETRHDNLKLDAPDTIPEKPVEVPPPVVELPQPAPKAVEPPPPPPEPKPVPRPQPRRVAPPVAPAPQPAPEDDSFFGLGQYFNGLPLPLIGGAVAGLLALLGGLFWFLRRKKKAQGVGDEEEFTPEQIETLVKEMEQEHGSLDVDFDQVSASSSVDDGVSEEQPITRLEPISSPYVPESNDDNSSPFFNNNDDEKDALASDDFFKDLEVSVGGSEDEVMNDPAISHSDLDDNFFDDLAFETGTNDEDDDFLSSLDSRHSSSESKEDDFAALDDFSTPAPASVPEAKKATSGDDDFDDFFGGSDDDDFFKEPSAPVPEAKKSTGGGDDLDDFFGGSDDEPPAPVAAVKEEEKAKDSGDDGLDFFKELESGEEEKSTPPAPSLSKESDDAHSLEFSLDDFDNDDDNAAASFSGLDAVVDPSLEPAKGVKDFFDEEERDEKLDIFSAPEPEKAPAPAPAAPPPPPPPAPKLAKPQLAPKPAAPTLAPKPAVPPPPPPPPVPKVDEEAMEINLDMAKSFISMGKSSKARSWLEEVLEVGTDEQKKQANEMLRKIDK